MSVKSEWIDELIAQIETHTPEVVDFYLETDSGGGYLEIMDVTYEDDRIKVRFA